MIINWRAILSGLLGGVIAAFVTWYAAREILDPAGPDPSWGQIGRAAAVGFAGGVLGTVVGWIVNGRREAGLTGIAAIVSLVGAAAATVAWVTVAAPLDETGLYLIGTILLLGGALVGLALFCGLTVAILKPASHVSERDGVEGY